ncbi:MAG: nucleotidyltransferase family protein [Candidatus Brocadiaceae bacterium]|nr:nucleotidyltransferase family protein [Candidatus Brocadiaceae bacterium]
MLNQDYKEMLQILQKHNVDHILVGAYALAAQGYPRNTLDIDIWVDPTSQNSSKVYKALAQFGAPLHDINVNTFKDEGIVFQIGIAPRRIDIITEISGDIKFEEAKMRSTLVDIEGISLNILSIEDLIKNKISTGRPKDIVDVRNLKKHLKNHNE